MKRLLRINASPRGERSRAGAIADHLLSRLRDHKAELEIERLDLFDAELPPFDQKAVEGRYHMLVGNPVEPEQEAAWEALKQWIEHFLSFDGWLFATPMWNFGLPYRLKHYIDVLTHPGFTFRNDVEGNVEGLAGGRTALIIAASAMPFGSMPEIEAMDFQLPFLKTWLGFIGVTDIHAVRVAGTFGPPESVEAAMKKAREDADTLADQLLSRPPRV